MHPFSSLTIGIFVAGYITARWDLVTRLYELSIFAWDHGVVVSRMFASSNQNTHILQSRATKAFLALSLLFVLLAIPIQRIAAHEAHIVRRSMRMKPLANKFSILVHQHMEYRPVNNFAGEGHLI